ncbi:MAG: DUF1015 domain-containing protein [Chitinophagaceae bacterium]|jgi:uncharacterized protein (DUF1015 family)|nr:DUF1015 domain-containing protein [Chitinophagaceae bacterium]
MAIVFPFKAIRPQPNFAAAVAAPPYDVLSSEEARTAAAHDQYSFLHVTKSEIDMPVDLSIYDSSVYEKAKSNLLQFIEQGVLFKEQSDCYYIYELIMDGRSQTGLVCCSSIDDYENDIIKKHEFTRPEKEKDRINHIAVTGAQTGNVFLAYRNVEKIDSIIAGIKSAHKPVYDFNATDGINHRVWIAEEKTVVDEITSIFQKDVPCTYIADGHHRAASAAKVRNAAAVGMNSEDDRFLTTLFPANELKIMPYNRVIKDLNGLSKEEFISALQDDFTISTADAPVEPKELHEFGMYVGGQWYHLTSLEGTYTNDPIGVLDVTILSKNVFEKLLDIQDQRTDKRIDFVGGIRGLKELERRVDSGEMQLAFSFYPVSIQQLFDISDCGEVMPPKSTWFEPKLRDGLLTHMIR